MGAILFRWRLAVIVGLTAAAIVVAVVLAKQEAPKPASLSDVVGLGVVFAVTGALLLLGFVLRTTGEARLGSVVYGQDAAPRVVTGGPFRLLRHPLYAGTWIWMVSVAAPYLPAVVVVAHAVVCAAALAAIAVYEEAALAEKLGAAWTRYAGAVPRFVGLPRRVDDDGVRVTAGALGLAALSNLGLFSLGAYRLLTAAGVEFVGLKSLNLLCIAVWLLVVVVRRVMAR